MGKERTHQGRGVFQLPGEGDGTPEHGAEDLSAGAIYENSIAEDDPVSGPSEAKLVKWGMMCCTCDGDQAWEALRSEDAPRLAILDWMIARS